MSRSHAGALAVAVLLCAVPLNAQAPKPKVPPGKKPVQTVPTGTVLVTSDLTCTLTIDGEPRGSVGADDITRLQLTEGEHLVVAISPSDGARWDGKVSVRAGTQHVLQIKLREARLTARIELPAGAAVVDVSPGEFGMGCAPTDTACERDEPVRRAVRLTRRYALLATETTVAQYRAFAAAAGVAMPAQPRWSTPRHPVVNVTWAEAARFCSSMQGRLPTEAEWERAARVQDGESLWPTGRFSPASMNSKDADRFDFAAPVGSFSATAQGLYDLAGNVWEWVADWYGPDLPPPGAVDPKGPMSALNRVVRGGSWSSPAALLRSSSRDGLSPQHRFDDVGFRCAVDRN